MNNNFTFVTGAWDIGRGSLSNKGTVRNGVKNFDWKRSFTVYTNYLEELISTGLNIIIFGDTNVKYLEDKYSNCKCIYYPNEKLYNEFPYFQKINNIRLSEKWYNQPQNG